MQTVNWNNPDLTLAGIDIGVVKYIIIKARRLPEYCNIAILTEV
jgi:hypothetical protein